MCISPVPTGYDDVGYMDCICGGVQGRKGGRICAWQDEGKAPPSPGPCLPQKYSVTN